VVGGTQPKRFVEATRRGGEGAANGSFDLGGERKKELAKGPQRAESELLIKGGGKHKKRSVFAEKKIRKEGLGEVDVRLEQPAG